MKHFFKPRVSGLLLTLLLFAGGTQTALAVGTQSGLTISNQATVNYEVGLVPQTAILSDDLVTGAGPTTFVVDNKVVLTVVADTANLNVTPGTTNQPLQFTITNTGNTTQGYSLSVSNGTTNIAMTNVRIFLDTDASGSFTVGDAVYTTGNNAGDLDPNGGTNSMLAFIVSDTPLTAVDLDVDTYNLVATTLNASTAVAPLVADAVTANGPADDPTTVEVVWADGTGTADGLRDGAYSASATYTVASAVLAVTKTAVVLDPFGGTYAIPGSTVTYTITVVNSGGIAATTVVISDAIPPETTLVSGTITLEIDSGGAVGQADSTPVTVTIPSLSGGSAATIIFQVMIQ